MVDVLAMIERMAEYGTAPSDGCALFGVGYEDAFARLKDKYLEARFARGGSRSDTSRTSCRSRGVRTPPPRPRSGPASRRS